MGVFVFTTHRRTVFTVKRDIEHAHAKLLVHLGLQLQAFAHACFHAAVVIANRQLHRARLGVLQHIARMRGGGGSGVRHSRPVNEVSEQMRHTRLFVQQFFERFVDARLAERIDGQAFHHAVFAVRAGDGETKHDIFGNAIPTLRRNAHGDPMAVGT